MSDKNGQNRGRPARNVKALETCIQCGEEKPVEAFHKTPAMKVPDRRCQPCFVAYARDRHLRKTYGVTTELYEELKAAQNGVCAICGSEGWLNRELAVDHDHTTGEVRGLLCGGCNVALGLFKDSPAALIAAIAYLARSLR